MLQTGQLIDKRYEVLEVLGEGGMGRVYRVRHRLLDREYALKELLGAGADAEAQFREEARILAGLSHPCLPRVTDYFSLKHQHCLVMDLVAGPDLQALADARQAPLSAAEVTPWLLQLLEALCYMHARHVVHRDIKPANLKLTPEGRLVLVDFGIAKAGEVAAPGRTGFHAHSAYTPYMAAPEQVMGQGTGPRTDLYAVGATFCYMVTGQLPPSAQGLAAPLGPVLARALAPDPAGRWPDAAAMARALGPPQPHPHGPPTTSRRDIRRPG